MTWWDAVKNWYAGKREEPFPTPSPETPDREVKYTGAADWLSKRVNLTTIMGSKELAAEWTEKARAQAFFSARVAEGHILDRLRKVSDAFSRGEIGQAEARTELKKFLLREGYDPKQAGLRNLASTARLNLILEQNARMAAAVGQYQAGMDPDMLEAFPYWRDISRNDEMVRDDHARYNGKVYSKLDPIWRRIFPPRDFRCRCRIEQLEEEEARSVGISVGGKLPPLPESGFAFDPAHAFEEFDFSSISDPDFRGRVEQQMHNKFKIPVMKPAGTPVANALDVRARNQELRETINHAINVIDSVHGDGALMKTPVLGSAPGGGALGCFTRYISGKHVTKTEIKILRTGDHPGLTTVHEIGHLIDAFGLGDGFTTGADSCARAEVKNWLDVVRASKSYQKLEARNDSHSFYLRSPKELWARCYAQYIARKSGDPVLCAELDKSINNEYNKIYGAQWPDDEFETIMPAMDKIFISMGWIK